MTITIGHKICSRGYTCHTPSFFTLQIHVIICNNKEFSLYVHSLFSLLLHTQYYTIVLGRTCWQLSPFYCHMYYPFFLHNCFLLPPSDPRSIQCKFLCMPACSIVTLLIEGSIAPCSNKSYASTQSPSILVEYTNLGIFYTRCSKSLCQLNTIQ